MKYKNIKQAKFLARPNRFIAEIEIDGKETICHVKNTGRCKELLIPDANIFVNEVDSPHRKTKYDLISVYKGERLVNIDSQIPNKVFHKWIDEKSFFPGLTNIRPEYSYGNSRFDFLLKTARDKILVEIKGVTLEEEGVALFPDAPTERGIKHINELIDSLSDGYKAYIFFIIQMKDIKHFSPNVKTHQAFAEALKRAKDKGVKIRALDCYITPNTITANDFVEVKI